MVQPILFSKSRIECPTIHICQQQTKVGEFMSEEYHHVLINAWDRLDNLDIKKSHDAGYDQLFSRLKGSKVLVFNPLGENPIHSGITAAATKHNVEIQTHSLDGIEPPANWSRSELASKPFKILEGMIDGWRKSNLDSSKALVTIVGGSSLHGSLLLVFSRIIGASIALNEGDLKAPNYKLQTWLSQIENYTQVKPNEVEILKTFLNSKTGPDFSKTSFREPDFWKDAKEITGSDIDAAKSTGLSSSIQRLIKEKYIIKNDGRPMQYRLTAKGWTTALTNSKFGTENPFNARSSRISGFRLKRRHDGSVPTIGIANALPAVEDWLTIMGIEGGKAGGGIHAFDDKKSGDILSSDDEEMRKEWLNFLNMTHMSEHSWGLLGSVGDQEEIFCQLCEWIWPRLTGETREWSLDLTQFTNKQIPFIAHFAFSTGIPMTYTSAPRLHQGVHAGVVAHDIQNRSDRIFSVPNLDFAKILKLGVRAKPTLGTQVLLALLYQEEKFHLDNSTVSVNPYESEEESDTADDGDDSNREEKLGGSFDQLVKFVKRQTDIPIKEKLTFISATDHSPTKRDYKNLILDGYIRFEELPGKARSRHLTLSPMGRLIARILRDKLLSFMEEE